MIPALVLNTVGLTYRPEKYCGDFQDGLFHGTGTLSYEKGHRFVTAEFHNGLINKVIKTISKTGDDSDHKHFMHKSEDARVEIPSRP